MPISPSKYPVRFYLALSANVTARNLMQLCLFQSSSVMLKKAEKMSGKKKKKVETELRTRKGLENLQIRFSEKN